MSEQDKNFSSGGSNSNNDETIRRCLLGAGTPDELAAFEELLLLDDDMENRVRRAELELADDYSFDRLSRKDRELFAHNFLVTEERGQKLAVSQALRRALLEPEAETSASNEREIEAERKGLSPHSRRFRLNPGLFRFDHPAARLLLAGAALVLFAGLLSLALKSPRVRNPEVVRQQTAPSPDREYAHPVSSQGPSPSVESAPPSPPPSEVVPLAKLVLQTGRHVDSQQIHFTTPVTEGDVVRLELLLGSHQSATYEAKLLTKAGEQISAVTDLRPVFENEHAKVVWDVPAQLLKAGDYQVTLRRDSDSQTSDAGLYSFRVR